MEKPSYIVQQLGFDMRVEALASRIWELNPTVFDSSDQFRVIPKGHLTRGVGKEVESIQAVERWMADEQRVYTYFEVNKEGLFDILPAFLFLDPEEPADSAAEKAAVLTRQSQAGRDFLKPFDTAFFQARIDIEHQESAAAFRSDAFISKLLGENEADSDAAIQHWKTMILYLPLIGEIMENPELRQSALERILNKKVSIVTNAPAPIEIPGALQSKLGDNTLLGSDFILGSTFMDGIPTSTLSVLIDDEEELATMWLDGCPLSQFVDQSLVPLLFPSGSPVSTTIEIVPEKKAFMLHPENGQAPMKILGYSTYL